MTANNATNQTSKGNNRRRNRGKAHCAPRVQLSELVLLVRNLQSGEVLDVRLPCSPGRAILTLTATNLLAQADVVPWVTAEILDAHHGVVRFHNYAVPSVPKLEMWRAIQAIAELQPGEAITLRLDCRPSAVELYVTTMCMLYVAGVEHTVLHRLLDAENCTVRFWRADY